MGAARLDCGEETKPEGFVVSIRAVHAGGEPSALISNFSLGLLRFDFAAAAAGVNCFAF